MVKYIGSKRALLPWILGVIDKVASLTGSKVVLDLFSGTSRVAHGLKAKGYYVVANDLYTYAHVLAKALVEADARRYPEEAVAPLLAELASLPPRRGWFTRLYCQEARYFQVENCERIEAAREAIRERYSGDGLLEAVLLTSLLLGADRVDSTVGVQMAYLKRWAPRSYRPLRLLYPPLLPGEGLALQGDAVEVAKEVEGDIAYLDPPYNGHSYLGNYHVWETLVLWDEPEVYGVARKRLDVRWRRSAFASRSGAERALEGLLGNLRARHVVLSYSDEGFLSPGRVSEILSGWGYTARLSRPHRRYVGALIGVHGPKGERVGSPGPTRNTEFLFVASQERRVVEAFLEEG